MLISCTTPCRSCLPHLLFKPSLVPSSTHLIALLPHSFPFFSPHVPPLIFPFLSSSVTTAISPSPSLLFSLSLLFIPSVIVRKMYCALCSSPSVSLIVWVMALSFSRRVAVWGALEQHKSDAPERHNCSLIGKSIRHEFLNFFLILHSRLPLPPVSVSSFVTREAALIGVVLSEPQCVCSHQSGSWKELS